MAEVSAEVEVAAPLADVWDLYFNPESWRSWVDGFARVTASDDYPRRGGSLSWESTPAGRGRVSERVLEHQPRRLHRVAYTDPGSAGELETSFEMVPAGDHIRRTRVVQMLRYELQQAGPFAAVTERLFIRSQMRRSLQRSLGGLMAEAAEAAEAKQVPATD